MRKQLIAEFWILFCLELGIWSLEFGAWNLFCWNLELFPLNTSPTPSPYTPYYCR